MAVVWKHPEGILTKFPNLKLVSSLGAGVEHLLKDPDLSKDLVLSRIVAPSLSEDMFKYVFMGILLFEKQMATVLDQQRKKTWRKPRLFSAGDFTVGVLGLGEIGGYVAKKIAALDYRVIGYSNRPKQISGIKTFSRQLTTLQYFLSQVNVLVNLLPQRKGC